MSFIDRVRDKVRDYFHDLEHAHFAAHPGPPTVIARVPEHQAHDAARLSPPEQRRDQRHGREPEPEATLPDVKAKDRKVERGREQGQGLSQ
jgi:hypothetical protein